jgi:hypothetical protein
MLQLHSQVFISGPVENSLFIPGIIRGYLSVDAKGEGSLMYLINCPSGYTKEGAAYEKFSLEIDNVIAQANEHCEKNSLTLMSY